MSNTRIYDLLNNYLTSGCTPEEEAELLQRLDDSLQTENAKKTLGQLMHGISARRPRSHASSMALLQKVMETVAVTEGERPAATPVNVRRAGFWSRSMIRYAAAVVVLFGALAYLMIIYRNPAPIIADNSQKLQNTVGPGGHHAILTLADGSTILLEDAANGTVASQGDVKVIKLDGGQISYRVPDEATREAALWNTMSTPKGGQYKVTLPDGTEVWLNAASSIRYPTAFTGRERRVEVTGEVYFEVAADKVKPFVVKSERMEIEVLGTSFNINTYDDEPVNSITLVSGSVKVKGKNNALLLKPGQQALAGKGDLLTETEADVSKETAWRNGVFQFKGAGIETVMRELARWYNLEIVYKGNIPARNFEGKILRSLNLEKVLKILEQSNVHFELEGRKLLILPSK